MYRAFALKVLRAGLSPDQPEPLTGLAAATRIELRAAPAAGHARTAPAGSTSGLDSGSASGSGSGSASGNRVLLDGEDVTALLRTAEVADAASRVSVHPAIRRWMVELQRQLGLGASTSGMVNGVVMEGRDIGTVVFPDAPVKIFLDASPEARGERRYLQTSHEPKAQPDVQPDVQLDVQHPLTRHDTGQPPPPKAVPEAVLQGIRERDARDRGRADSPLRPAGDALVIDSTTLTLEQVVARASAAVEAYLATGFAPPADRTS